MTNKPQPVANLAVYPRRDPASLVSLHTSRNKASTDPLLPEMITVTVAHRQSVIYKKNSDYTNSDTAVTGG